MNRFVMLAMLGLVLLAPAASAQLPPMIVTIEDILRPDAPHDRLPMEVTIEVGLHCTSSANAATEPPNLQLALAAPPGYDVDVEFNPEYPEVLCAQATSYYFDGFATITPTKVLPALAIQKFEAEVYDGSTPSPPYSQTPSVSSEFSLQWAPLGEVALEAPRAVTLKGNVAEIPLRVTHSVNGPITLEAVVDGAKFSLSDVVLGTEDSTQLIVLPFKSAMPGNSGPLTFTVTPTVYGVPIEGAMPATFTVQVEAEDSPVFGTPGVPAAWLIVGLVALARRAVK
jgi:hypothetical protein